MRQNTMRKMYMNLVDGCDVIIYFTHRNPNENKFGDEIKRRCKRKNEKFIEVELKTLNLSNKNDVEKIGNEIGRVGKEIKSNRNKDLITKFFGIEDFEKKIGVVSHQKFDGRKPNCFVDSFLYHLCELCYEEENEKLILCIGNNPIGMDGYLERNWRRIGINQPIQYGNYR